ncbi:MAG: glycosyltransferase family 1 protein [Caulobacteraceae bacterium]|nr:glycosyltransferase family 1 protein [Caulobacteraceae bacterium]
MTREISTIPGARRPRVALFSGNYNYTLDGANKTLNRLVGHLQAQAGMQVRIYSPTSPQPAFPPVGELISVPSVHIPMRPDYRLALGLPPSLQREVEAFRPDVIHVSAPDLLGSAALKLARKLDVPVIASVHTHFDSYLDYYALGWLKPFIQNRMQAFYSACDYVLAPTPAIAEQLQAYVSPARVRVWARGVDAQLFNPARRSEEWRRSHGFADGRPVVVFMGRIVMEKGLAIFVDAIRRLERDYGHVPVLVIGDGPALPWFKERLPGAVFTGFLSGEALATAIASGDIFLNPSNTETFGNVNLEAMASGLALVCADAPNSRTLVQHGRSGILCQAQEPQAYCEAILALLDDPARRASMGRAAQLQSASYCWSQILDQIVDVYREAVSAPRFERPAHSVHGHAKTATPRFRELVYGALAKPVPMANDRS